MAFRRRGRYFGKNGGRSRGGGISRRRPPPAAEMRIVGGWRQRVSEARGPGFMTIRIEIDRRRREYIRNNVLCCGDKLALSMWRPGGRLREAAEARRPFRRHLAGARK